MKNKPNIIKVSDPFLYKSLFTGEEEINVAIDIDLVEYSKDDYDYSFDHNIVLFWGIDQLQELYEIIGAKLEKVNNVNNT